MATFNKFDAFAGDLASGLHDFRTAGDAIYVYLTSNAPNAATHTIKAELAGITEQFGYAAADIANDLTELTGTATVTGVDVTWTAVGGAFGAFRYAVLYNETTLDDPLIGWWDYGSSITVSAGESFTVDFGASIITVT